MERRRVSIDFETRSVVDLARAGPYLYADHPTTEILLVGWRHPDTREVRSDIVENSLPEELLELARDPEVIFQAHNAQFERLIWNKVATKLGAPEIPLERWRCTMALAAYRGLPRSLASLAGVLGTHYRKAGFGGRLVKLLTMPLLKARYTVSDPALSEQFGLPPRIKVTMTPMNAYGWMFVDPAPFWEPFRVYNKLDVETEWEIAEALGVELPEEELRVYQFDQRVNDRGVPLDVDYIENALALDEAIRMRTMERLRAGTGLENVMSAAQFQSWLRENGVNVTNSKRDTLVALLDDESIPEHVRDIIAERISAASISRRKFSAARLALSPDGRARGLFGYHGAATGRWTSSRIQLHNLPRQTLGLSPEALVELLASRDPEWVEVDTGHPAADVLRDALRGMVAGKPGYPLVVADFSSIEARVLAWLAGEEWKIELFRKGGDPYIAAAERIYPELAGRITKESPERQKGKVAELALGYQGWIGAYTKMAGRNAPPVEEIERICHAWRQAHPKTVMFWRMLERCAVMAVCRFGEAFGYRGITFRGVRSRAGHRWLVCRLRNGKRLFYLAPDVHYVDNKPVLTYHGLYDRKGGAHGIGRVQLYGGVLTENVVQATAREILVEAMLAAEEEGYSIVGHVHDEIIAEVPADSPLASVERLIEIMIRPRPWRQDLPLAAAGWTGYRYRK